VIRGQRRTRCPRTFWKPIAVNAPEKPAAAATAKTVGDEITLYDIRK
jgi:hypothetical protein